MTRLTLPRIVFAILFSNAFLITGEAQISRAEKGKLLMNDPRPNVSSSLSTAAPVTHQRFRTFDGTINNIRNIATARWGAADIPFFKELPAAYGFADPKNAMGGEFRPTARKISNILIDEPVTRFTTKKLSTLVYQWGQFLDHEMTLTPTGTTEYVPIKLPPDEKIFTEEISFYRSVARPGTGVGNSVRQQSNMNTAWIDGSVVYGSDPARARWLRKFINGKLKTSAGNLMPYNTINGELSSAIDPNAPGMANDGNKTIKTFVAGDERAAKNPVLASIHTIFVREHNRICDRLVAEGIRNDELIYQMARKEVGALIQAITYQEFLPALGVRLSLYSGYKDYVRPDIMNTFATAGYRLGHTMVADDVLLLATTDQFNANSMIDVNQARELLSRLPDEYSREYYEGIICERHGKSILGTNNPEREYIAYEWMTEAMDHYENAERLRPSGNDDALLRWNTCVRLINLYHLVPRKETYVESQLE